MYWYLDSGSAYGVNGAMKPALHIGIAGGGFEGKSREGRPRKSPTAHAVASASTVGEVACMTPLTLEI